MSKNLYMQVQGEVPDCLCKPPTASERDRDIPYYRWITWGWVGGFNGTNIASTVSDQTDWESGNKGPGHKTVSEWTHLVSIGYIKRD